MVDATPLLRLYARRRLARLARLDAVAAQQATLHRLIARAAGTRFGRDHGFAGIRTVDAFQAQVPLRRFADFWDDYWRDAFPNIGGQTWPGPIRYFAETSGTTTNVTKHIPVSPAMVRSNRRAALDILVFHTQARPHTKVMGGRSFMLGGNPNLAALAPGVRSGDLTGIAAREVPFWAKSHYFPVGPVARITQWDDKVAAQGRESLRRDIRMIAGTTSWLLRYFDELPSIAGQPGARIADLYPRLELVVHGGVDSTPYRDRFAAHLDGSGAAMREVYPASEGFLAVADRGPGAGLRLIVDNGLFFEFVPVDQLDAHNPPRHWLGTVETGVNYAVVLSTCAGCWAYVLGDTVRFVDLNPPRLLVTGRIATFLSAFGEHLSGAEIERAVTAAAQAIGRSVQDFTVTPVFPTEQMATGHHRFIVEFTDGPPPADALDVFAHRLDAVLGDGNDDYRAHRGGGFGMAAPVIDVAPPGTFTRWMAARGKLGGQNKVPRVITDATLLAGLDQAIGETA